MKSVIHRGFTCKCDKEERYPSYIYAHYDEPMIFTCECGRKYTILNGVAKWMKKVRP